MNHPQEDAFVRAFIVPEKRDRYLQLLSHPKRRGKILSAMYHSLDIIGTRALPISNAGHSAEAVAKFLQGKGAGEMCYLISPQRDLDQQEMPLWDVLSRLISEDGVAIACCVPGRLAYYKAELTQYVLEYNS